MTLYELNVVLAHDLILPQPRHDRGTAFATTLSERLCLGRKSPGENPASALDMPCAPRKTTIAHPFRFQASQPVASENQRQPTTTVRSFPTHPRRSANARFLRPSRSDLEERCAMFCKGATRPLAPQHNRTRYASPGETCQQTRSPANPARKTTVRTKARTGTANARWGK